MAKEKSETALFRQYVPPAKEGEAATQPRFYRMRVKRSFFLDVCDGPAVSIPVGAEIEVTIPYAIELWYARRVEPVEPTIPDSGEYIALRMFTVPGEDGKWLHVTPAMILKLDKETASEFMRLNRVRPILKEHFDATILTRRD